LKLPDRTGTREAIKEGHLNEQTPLHDLRIYTFTVVTTCHRDGLGLS